MALWSCLGDGSNTRRSCSTVLKCPDFQELSSKSGHVKSKNEVGTRIRNVRCGSYTEVGEDNEDFYFFTKVSRLIGIGEFCLQSVTNCKGLDSIIEMKVQ